MELIRALGSFLMPGMLIGYGLAVTPRRELLGRGLSSHKRRLLQALPERSLAVGWLLMAGTLLLRWGGNGLPGELLTGRCILLDLMALIGMGAWAVQEPQPKRELRIAKGGKIHKKSSIYYI